MSKVFIEERHLHELLRIIKELYPKSIVWAYGSRVDGSAHSGSDLDLAIVDYGQHDGEFLALKQALVESNLPFLIDIFELKRLPESFQEQIKNRHVVLFDGQQDSV